MEMSSKTERFAQFCWKDLWYFVEGICDTNIIFSEAIMKILKRVLVVVVLVLAALIISYLIYTGGQLHA